MSLPPNLDLPTRLDRIEENTTHHCVKVGPGILPEHVTDPFFWQHVSDRNRSRNLHPEDMVTVIALDGSFEMWLRVVEVDIRGQWTKTRTLFEWRGETKSTIDQYPDQDGYTIEFGGAHKWRIIRGGDIVEKFIPTREAAIAMLAEIKADKPAKAA